jgi:hypothetical protein
MRLVEGDEQQHVSINFEREQARRNWMDALLSAEREGKERKEGGEVSTRALDTS